MKPLIFVTYSVIKKGIIDNYIFILLRINRHAGKENIQPLIVPSDLAKIRAS